MATPLACQRNWGATSLPRFPGKWWLKWCVCVCVCVRACVLVACVRGEHMSVKNTVNNFLNCLFQYNSCMYWLCCQLRQCNAEGILCCIVCCWLLVTCCMLYSCVTGHSLITLTQHFSFCLTSSLLIWISPRLGWDPKGALCWIVTVGFYRPDGLSVTKPTAPVH